MNSARKVTLAAPFTHAGESLHGGGDGEGNRRLHCVSSSAVGGDENCQGAYEPRHAANIVRMAQRPVRPGRDLVYDIALTRSTTRRADLTSPSGPHAR